MPQITISISFNPETEQRLIDAISDGNRSGNIKNAIAFKLRYQDLLPKLDDTSDLLTVVSQMAVQQEKMLSMIAGLSEQVNRLRGGVVVPESEIEDNGWNESELAGQIEIMGDFE